MRRRASISCTGISMSDGIVKCVHQRDKSQLESKVKEENRMMHGTTKLNTDRLLLRPYKPEDADTLYSDFGQDPAMYEYSGWNPYATQEMAEQTVSSFIASYQKENFYGWAICCDDILIGTVGAYDHDPDTNSIEVGVSIARSCWGRGFGSEAVKAVITFLMEHEDISCVRAWCAADNAGSAKIMEKAGMKCVRVEEDALEIGEKLYDKHIYEKRK